MSRNVTIPIADLTAISADLDAKDEEIRQLRLNAERLISQMEKRSSFYLEEIKEISNERNDLARSHNEMTPAKMVEILKLAASNSHMENPSVIPMIALLRDIFPNLSLTECKDLAYQINSFTIRGK